GLMGDLIGLIAKRLSFGVLTLLVISVLIFMGTEALPGDLAEAILGQSATPDALAAIREKLNLNLPSHERYVIWLSSFLQGDLGVSLANGREISSLISGRFANTLFLASVAAAVSVPLSVTLGLMAALYQGSIFDRVVSMATLSTISFPEFFIGYVLIVFLSVQFSVFPSISSVTDDMSFFEKLYAIALPVMTLTLVVMAHMMRLSRAAIISILNRPFIEMAELKGLSRFRVIVHHAFPNALAPIINVVVLNLAYLVVGVIIVEVVFVYPGMGQLFVDSVSKRDLPMVQACGLIFAGTYVLLNLTADVLSIITNPRLRYPK
ncbi:ABC transporter permease, partial [Kiloniella laminariae]